MSDNYKVIRRAKEAMNNLIDIKGWSVNQLVNEIGITHTMVNEITTQEAVSVKIRNMSVEKLRNFINKFDNGIDKPARKGSLRTAPQVDEFAVPVPESMQESIPEERGIKEAPGANRESGDKMLDELNVLANKFKMKGWKLDITLSRIYTP
jgi:hypothetical protein